MITDGVTVLAIVNLDSDSGAAIEEKAKQAGRQDDRLRPADAGRLADVYISFDNSKVGALQGEGLEKCLGDKTQHHLPQRLADRQQRHPVLAGRAQRPRQGRRPTRRSLSRPSPTGTTTRPSRSSSSCTPRRTARSTASTPPTTVSPAASISILKKNGQAGKVPVTGQDATVEGLQNILAGTQCMTIQKSANGPGRRAGRRCRSRMVKGDKPQHDRHRQGRHGQPRRSGGPARPGRDRQGERQGRHRLR